jgi:hypothetical protein
VPKSSHQRRNSIAGAKALPLGGCRRRRTAAPPAPRLLSPEMKADSKSSLKYGYIAVGGGGAGCVAACVNVGTSPPVAMKSQRRSCRDDSLIERFSCIAPAMGVSRR